MMRWGLWGLAGVAAAALVAGALWFVRPALAPPTPLAATNLDPAVTELLQRLHRVAAARPRDIDARLRLAMAQHANGLHDTAEISCSQILEVRPRHARARYYRATLLAHRGAVDEAIDDLRIVTRLDHAYVPAHWRLGNLLLDRGEVDAADEAFEAALAQDPNALAARAGKARIALHRHEYDVAIRLLQPVRQARPNDAQTRHLLGQALQKLGLTEAAEQEIAAVRALAQPDPVPWPDEWYEALDDYRVGYASMLRSAQAKLDAGDVSHAITMLEHLRQHHAQDLVLLNTLARAHFAAGAIDRAIPLLEAAARIDPAHAPTQLNLAVGFERMGEAGRSLRHAQRATELNATFGAAHLHVGRLHAMHGRHDRAVEALRHAVRFGETRPEVRAMLGQLLVAIGAWDEAAQQFQYALHDDPAFVPAMVGLAAVRIERGELSEATRLIEAARARDPNDRNVQLISERLRQALREQSTDSRASHH